MPDSTHLNECSDCIASSSYFQEDSAISQEISSLIQILHTSLHSTYHPNKGPISPHPRSPAPKEPVVVKRELSEPQKAHYYLIINQLYQFICSESDTKVRCKCWTNNTYYL